MIVVAVVVTANALSLRAFAFVRDSGATENALDESFVGSDSMSFQQLIDGRLRCRTIGTVGLGVAARLAIRGGSISSSVGSSLGLFACNVVFDALPELRVFFPEHLQGLLERGCQGLFAQAALLSVLAISLAALEYNAWEEIVSKRFDFWSAAGVFRRKPTKKTKDESKKRNAVSES